MLKGLSFEAMLGRHVVSILERQNELACHDILTIYKDFFGLRLKSDE